jgi:acyl dehydratase
MGELAGVDLGRRTLAYDERDAILHALAVGASADDLDLVYERRLRVLPTLALGLGLWAVEAAGGLGAYDRTATLHVGQSLTIHRPLPREGRFDSAARVAAVWDKGRAALVDVSVESELFDATYTIYVPGAGGFGGERGASSRAAPPDGEPEVRVDVATHRDQAALYRLTGDRHPVHIDPDIARSVGFSRPILHGLCTLGCAVRALAAATDRDPSTVTRVAARFAAPLYPGDAIALSAWRTDDGLRFAAAGDGGPVLDDGLLV